MEQDGRTAAQRQVGIRGGVHQCCVHTEPSLAPGAAAAEVGAELRGSERGGE